MRSKSIPSIVLTLLLAACTAPATPTTSQPAPAATATETMPAATPTQAATATAPPADTQTSITAAIEVHQGGAAECLQLASDADDIPTQFFMADPSQKTVQPLAPGRQPYAYANVHYGQRNGLLSPDGRYTAQVQSDPIHPGQTLLVIADRQTASVAAVRPTAAIFPTELVWANDSTQIAFLMQGSDQLVLGRVSADGSQFASALIPAGLSLDPQTPAMGWSADSQFIDIPYAESQSNQPMALLYQASDLQLTASSPVALAGARPVWSPQGHRFASVSPTELMVGSPEGDLNQVYPLDMASGADFPDQLATRILWSPGGIYVALIWGTPGYQQTIDFFNIQDSSSIPDIKGPWYDTGYQSVYSTAGWSPDNRTFIFAAPTQYETVNPGAQPIQFELSSVEMSTRAVRSLAVLPEIHDYVYPFGENFVPDTHGKDFTSWGMLSPDGTRIAASTPTDGGIALFVSNLNGSDQQVLIRKAQVRVNQFSWSPDGQNLAYIIDNHVRQSGAGEDVPAPPQPRLVWQRADGSSAYGLTAENLLLVGWEMDENLLLFLMGNGDNNQLMALNMSTLQTYPLAGPVSQQFFDYTMMNGQWSVYPVPNAHSAVITAVADTASLEGGGGEGTGLIIYLAVWDGSAFKVLDNSDQAGLSAPIWSSDGTMFAYNLNNEIKVFNASGMVLWAPTRDEVITAVGGPADAQSLMWIPCER